MLFWAFLLFSNSVFAGPVEEAKTAVGEFHQSRSERARRSIGKWSETVAFHCGKKPCSPERRAVLEMRLAGALERMPAFLQGTRPAKIIWEEVPGSGGPDGGENARVLELTVPADSSARLLEEVLVHELSHVWERDHGETRDEFLALRYATGNFQRALASLWLDVERGTGGGLQEEPVPGTPSRGGPSLERQLAAMRLPRRHARDMHAAKSRREYWAVSVELAYRSWRKADWDSLRPFAIETEIAWMKIFLAGE